MALLFICDNCDEKYPAKTANWGIRYKDEGKEYSIEPEDPCYKCEAIANKAREEALAKRKKKV